MIGTIPRSAIQAFLRAPRDDHRWLKQLTTQQLDAAIAALEPRPQLTPTLRKHQKVSFLLGVAYPQFAYWLDMGSGKTLLALELMRYWWQAGLVRRALIVVRSDKAFPTWQKQIERWGINLPYLVLNQESSKARWAALEGFKEGLILVSYPGLVYMLTKLVWVKGKRKQAKRKQARRINRDLVEQLGGGLDALLLDESTTVGHHDSLRTRACGRIRRYVKFCYALAGRPFGRDPTLLWSQYHILDGGATFGETLGLFRAAFFKAEANPWDGRGYAQDYTFDKKMEPALMQLAQHRSISYGEDECGDVPAFVPLIEEVRLPAEAKAYYRKVVEQIIAAKGNLQAMENAFIRMRQLSSGFLGFRSTDTDKRVEVAFDENPKLEALLDLLDGLPRGRKAVVFYDFTWSGRKIHGSLKSIDRDGVWVWSGTKDYAAALRRFQTDPDCTVCVLNNQIGAYSLDGLQDVANYCIFYESPVAVLDRDQAERRLRRQGQPRKVFQYDMVARGTFDYRILEFHKQGADLLQALRANPEALLKGL